MTNQELELKIKEILANENFFDMIEATFAFEKEYKQTAFYKNTKMSLAEVIKQSKLWYALQLNGITNKIQKIINDLDITKINELMEQMGLLFKGENEEIFNMIQEVKDITL